MRDSIITTNIPKIESTIAISTATFSIDATSISSTNL
jgi:hypothetical protein